MSDRPTREFSTTGGHKVVLNDYITGGENWLIRQIYIRGIKTTDANASDTAFDAERKAFELVVVSVDGKLDDVATEVMSLPLADYNEVAAQVTPIVEGKKKSETS